MSHEHGKLAQRALETLCVMADTGSISFQRNAKADGIDAFAATWMPFQGKRPGAWGITVHAACPLAALERLSIQWERGQA